MPHLIDTRPQELADAHRVLAREILAAESRRQAQLSNQIDAPALELSSYPTLIDIGADYAVDLRAELFSSDDREIRLAAFNGKGGGSLVTQSRFWGDCCLSHPLSPGESLPLSFLAHYTASLLTIIWWHKDGVLACFAGLSPGQNSGLIGGAGEWLAERTVG